MSWSVSGCDLIDLQWAESILDLQQVLTAANGQAWCVELQEAGTWLNC